MKKYSVAALALAVLLVSAVSAQAGIIWTANAAELKGSSPTGVYGNYGSVFSKWTVTTGNLSGVQGSGPLALELGLTYTVPAGFYSTAVKGTLPNEKPTEYVGTFLTETGGTYGWTTTLPVAFKSGGVYTFDVSLAGFSPLIGFSGVSWTVTSATLSKTPIPAAALLLGSGVVGLMGLGRTLRKKFQA